MYDFEFYYALSYLLGILGMGICLVASALVDTAMSKYKKVSGSLGITGAEAARRILHNEGLDYVRVECLEAQKGDHYDPVTNTVKLSYHSYYKNSITAVAVAAHECGHAIQHDENYVMLSLRSAMVPVANVASNLGMPFILLGVILSWNMTLIRIGIWAFILAVLFQLVTLPVEFDASQRAVAKVIEYGLLSDNELVGCKKVLTAAAITYVAATATAILQVFRLMILFGGRRRKD